MTLTKEQILRIIESRISTLKRDGISDANKREELYLHLIIELQHITSKHEKRILALEERIIKALPTQWPINGGKDE